MSMNSACSRISFIEKLREMHFYGPVNIAGNQYMIYHGRAFAIPGMPQYSIAQFRFLVKEVESIASHEEWDR